MSRPSAIDDGRGRGARRPSEINSSGWRDILLRTKSEITGDHMPIVSAGVAFYTLLSLFPAIAAVISVWGLLADPQRIGQQIEALTAYLPSQAAGIISSQARDVASGAGGTITFTAAGGLLFAFWSASKGVKSLIEGLNIAYGEDEKRGFIRLNLVALGLTLAFILGLVVVLGLIAVLPVLLGGLGLDGIVATLATLLRWPLLFVLMMLALAAIYRYGPSRDAPRWRWVSWGAVAATVLWVAGSIAFSAYVSNFGRFNETYGSIGAIIILMTWLWLSSFIVLAGAELNAEMEHQTGRDTTQGAPKPRGRRGARMADTVGERR